MARKSFLTSGAKNWYGKPTFSQKKGYALSNTISEQPQIEVTHTYSMESQRQFLFKKEKRQ